MRRAGSSNHSLPAHVEYVESTAGHVAGTLILPTAKSIEVAAVVSPALAYIRYTGPVNRVA